MKYRTEVASKSLRQLSGAEEAHELPSGPTRPESSSLQRQRKRRTDESRRCESQPDSGLAALLAERRDDGHSPQLPQRSVQSDPARQDRPSWWVPVPLDESLLQSDGPMINLPPHLRSPAPDAIVAAPNLGPNQPPPRGAPRTSELFDLSGTLGLDVPAPWRPMTDLSVPQPDARGLGRRSGRSRPVSVGAIPRNSPAQYPSPFGAVARAASTAANASPFAAVAGPAHGAACISPFAAASLQTTSPDPLPPPTARIERSRYQEMPSTALSAQQQTPNTGRPSASAGRAGAGSREVDYPLYLLLSPFFNLSSHGNIQLPPSQANSPLAQAVATQQFTYNHEQLCPFSYVSALIDLITQLESDPRILASLVNHAAGNHFSLLPRVKPGHVASFNRATMLFNHALVQVSPVAAQPVLEVQTDTGRQAASRGGPAVSANQRVAEPRTQPQLTSRESKAGSTGLRDVPVRPRHIGTNRFARQGRVVTTGIAGAPKENQQREVTLRASPPSQPLPVAAAGAAPGRTPTDTIPTVGVNASESPVVRRSKRIRESKHQRQKIAQKTAQDRVKEEPGQRTEARSQGEGS